MSIVSTRIVLARRPQGWVTEDCFRLEATALPALEDGQILVRNDVLSLDPYMRGRMNDAKSYAAKVEIGATMIGGTVGVVVESRNARFPVGASVVGSLGWQTHANSDGRELQRIFAPDAPPSYALGVLGMPGATAWIGLFDIATPKSGETLVVSAAAGAVGSIVGQLGKQHGMRVVGIAGGSAKCRFVVDELGFDACVDYKSEAFRNELVAATPDGIDVDFENVGGEVMDAIVARMNPFGRIALCGLVSQYNATAPIPFRNAALILIQRLRAQGFIVTDHLARWPTALADLAARVRAGKLIVRETWADGLENAPKAFLGMLRGENVGKQLVRLA
ncbi:MAG: NADP-dependent oxidoreductase [Polyangiales bacterium]